MNKLLSPLVALSLVACSVTVKAEDPACADEETYYAGIDPSGDLEDFTTAITTTISVGTRYIAYDGNWAYLKAIDDVGDGQVRLLYAQVPDDDDNSVNNFSGRPPADAWNREHVWPQSRGVKNNPQARGDLHHIRPAYVSVNGTRANKNFGIVEHEEGTEVYGPGAGGVGRVLSGYTDDDDFEPVGVARGQVARMVFYMALRYPDLTVTQFPDDRSGTKQLGDLCELLNWSRDNPVDAFETVRNDRVCAVQWNRNPFIDNPDWAETIWRASCD